MTSIIQDYNYDVFISYRQKDNKGDKWVSEFVEALKTELESTFKEEISVYFDINPHDGLLETHDVDESLKEKLKCLIFIPIISRTYCDPKAFAWEHEFKAFVEETSKDEFGLKVKLPSGNVASRVLPVVIHDLDVVDINECESVLGGVMRGVEFIYMEPGVNKPLTTDDDENKNLNGTKYKLQINKTANAIKEILAGMTTEPSELAYKSKEPIEDRPPVKEKSIIVLPFENMSPDPDQEYFSDGLTEEIITDLSHIHNLLVISRNSAMTFKGTKKKTREIAGDVNVRYVLEGSVRKAGNNLRITVQLIDALTDTHLWAEKYSGTLDDVFDIQERVSRSIVDKLKLKLTPEEKSKIAENPISDVYAYECFIKARYEIWKATEESLDKALVHLEKGMEMNGENPVILAGIGYVYFQYFNYGYKTDDIILQNAEEYANHALDIDPESVPANIVLANLRGWNKQPKEAIRLLKRAFIREPNNFDALIWFCGLCGYLGKSGSVKSYVERLLKIEPMNHMSHMTYSIVKLMDGDFPEAHSSIRRAYEVYSDELIIQLIYAEILVYRLNIDDALEVLEKLLSSSPDFIPGILLYSQILGLQDKKPDALKILNDPKIINWAKHDFSFSLLMAESFAILDKKDDALNWLELSIELGFTNFPFLTNYDPFLEYIRGEERFKKLMERVKLEWENFEI